jgi:acyl-CoA synthetase (AMP-forming)/AMP-acid ligase II
MNQEIRPMPTCLYQLLEIQAEKNPNAIAITAPGREPLTYGKLWDTIQNIVAGLNAIGVGRNDRVAVALANGPEMAVAFLGIASGATCAPLNPAYRTNEFDFYLSDLNAKALIIQSGVAETAVEVARKRGIPIIELSPVKEAETGIFSLTGGEAKPAKQAAHFRHHIPPQNCAADAQQSLRFSTKHSQFVAAGFGRLLSECDAAVSHSRAYRCAAFLPECRCFCGLHSRFLRSKVL